MKCNQWTLALAAAGVVSLGSVAFAEEAQHQVMTALQSTTLSGYVDTSAIWKIGGTGDRLSGRSFDGTSKQNGINLNVVDLTLEKPLDEGQWAAGYKVELWFGPDANTYGSQSVLATAASDFAIKQAYVSLRAPIGNGLDFEIGQWDNLLGYEVANSYANPNYSRSYAFAQEPLAHTGVLASYQFADWIKLSAGIADSMDNQINGRPVRTVGGVPGVGEPRSRLTYVSLLELTAPESFGALKGAKLYAGVDDGLNSRVGNSTGSDITYYYVGAAVPTPLEGLSVGASYDYRGTKQDNSDAINPDQATYANAVALYLTYKYNEKVSFANRAEYASGTSGAWTGFKPAGGEEFFAETLTLDYHPWGQNIVTRLEGRWDHDLSARRGGPAAFGNAAGLGDKNALSLALNVIYKF